MKLLYFVPEELPTFRADLAVLFDIELPRHGIHSHIVGMKGAAASVESNSSRSSTPSGSGGRLRHEWDYLAVCIRTLRTEGRSCDVIQVRDMVSIGLLALIWARLIGKPFVYWMSYLMSEGRLRNAREQAKAATGLASRVRARVVQAKGSFERWLLYRVVLRQADFVFVQSESMREFTMRKAKIPANRMSAVPMGVDVGRLNSDKIVPIRLEGWEHASIIAYLGTLDSSRRHDQLVDALALVRRSHPDARLLLIGDAPKRGATDVLIAYATSKGLGDAVHITGWLPSAKAWPLLAGADVAVSYFPRDQILDTNSPTKLLEYLALGLPAVGNDNPDQAWVLQQSNAGVLTLSTSAALATGICSVLSDPVKARDRASAGPAFIARERSYDVIARRVANTYSKICPRGMQ
jgi:glycosyltransferase involved in cell wall biosynthesis